jgi:hypothetical protein
MSIRRRRRLGRFRISTFGKPYTQVLPEVAAGIGAALITQLTIIAILAMMRPLAKAAIRSGFVIRDVTSGAFSVAGSQAGNIMSRDKAKAARRPSRKK